MAIDQMTMFCAQIDQFDERAVSSHDHELALSVKVSILHGLGKAYVDDFIIVAQKSSFQNKTVLIEAYH
jgi:hypothetical protein